MPTETDKLRRKRDLYLRRLYGLGLEDYENILHAQGGGCAICGKTPEQEGRNLAVEHDHKTGYVRGIACGYCNKYLIGRHRDSELLRKIADYLDQPQHPFLAVPRKKKRRRSAKRKPTKATLS